MKHKLFLISVTLFSCYYSFAQIDTAAARLNNYRDRVFSVFNKCNLHDEAIIKAIKEKKVIDIEWGRKALLQCSIEGIKQLDAMESFDGDPALIFSSREVLKFYKQLAESNLPQVRDFFILEENFLKIKNEFKKKPAKKYSTAEIYAYNNDVKRYNDGVTRYTQLTAFITNSRRLTLHNWNASAKIFMDAHKK